MNKEELLQAGRKAKAASVALGLLSEEEKNALLRGICEALVAKEADILAANAKDIEAAPSYGLSKAMVERLTLDHKKIADMAEGVRQLTELPDPCNRVLERKVLANGLELVKTSVPFGVIAMIYESRPNVTVDAATLSLKSGNACILRGGKEAHYTNEVVTALIQEVLTAHGVPAEAVTSILDPDRTLVNTLLTMRGIVDLAIPRGGAGLIRFVVETSSVPVIETGSGVCHTYVDKAADLAKALPIILNAKVQRPSVCNAMETLLIHKDIAEEFLPVCCRALAEAGVEIRGDARVCEAFPEAKAAEEKDWETEYGDLILSVRVVDSLEDAISHIAKYGTRHSECIVSEDAAAVRTFMNTVDAACVYANASTRFTDGFQFGLGAEIGISTQKLHVRGPVGLEPLVTSKYKIFGSGQVRG